MTSPTRKEAQLLRFKISSEVTAIPTRLHTYIFHNQGACSCMLLRKQAPALLWNISAPAGQCLRHVQCSSKSAAEVCTVVNIKRTQLRGPGLAIDGCQFPFLLHYQTLHDGRPSRPACASFVRNGTTSNTTMMCVIRQVAGQAEKQAVGVIRRHGKIRTIYGESKQLNAYR